MYKERTVKPERKEKLYCKMREVPLVINSKDAVTSDGGSRCTVGFQPPLQMGVGCAVELVSANSWHSMPNVKSTAVLNYMYTRVKVVSGVLVTTSDIPGTSSFPVGLYGPSSRNTAIGRHLRNHTELGRYDINLSGDENTGRVAVHLKLAPRDQVLTEGEYNITRLSVILGTPALLSSYLGYTGADNLSVEGMSEFEYIGNTSATLNSPKSILVDCGQCMDSMLNCKNTGIFATIPLNVGVGSQIQIQPLHAAKVSSEQMSNCGTHKMRMSLHDQDTTPLNMGGATFEVVLRVTSE